MEAPGAAGWAAGCHGALCVCVCVCVRAVQRARARALAFPLTPCTALPPFYTFLTLLPCTHTPHALSPARAQPYPTIVVPTGNFGNALAGYYAAEMCAEPLPPLLAATNANDAVCRALGSSGDYTRCPSATRPTLAPSMDISVSSNFERALYHAALACSAGSAGAACARVRALQAGLSSGAASNPLGSDMVAALGRSYASASASDAEIDSAIGGVLAGAGYALCPHSAAGWHAAVGAGAGARGVLLLATAHPAMFASGTPALAGHACGAAYAREVEGVAVGGGGAAAGGAMAGGAAVVPALPGHLRGLHLRPQRCLTLRMAAAGEGGEGGAGALLCKAVMDLCDTVVGGLQ